jgi:large subunit ribosomal protein L9
MEVILRKTVANVGRAGEIVKVKNGYGRNFLIPKGYAYLASEKNKRRVEAEAKRRSEQSAADEASARDLAERLAQAEVHIKAKTGEGDKLFGSIGSADIADELVSQGFTIDKRIIELDQPIKSIGVYKVPVRLHPNVHAEIRVWVVKDQ